MKLLSLVLGVGLMLLSGPAQSQSGGFGVPISDKVIYGEIELPNGHIASFGAREGTLVTVQDHRLENAPIAGFLPRLEGETDLTARLMTVEITDTAAGGQKIRQTKQENEETTRQIFFGAEVPITTSAAEYKLSLSHVATGRFQQKPLDPEKIPPAALARIFGKVGSGYCCVTCEGFTVCASDVELSCGSCTSTGRMLMPH